MFSIKGKPGESPLTLSFLVMLGVLVVLLARSNAGLVWKLTVFRTL